jgi:hypothetical protein
MDASCIATGILPNRSTWAPATAGATNLEGQSSSLARPFGKPARSSTGAESLGKTGPRKSAKYSVVQLGF